MDFDGSCEYMCNRELGMGISFSEAILQRMTQQLAEASTSGLNASSSDGSSSHRHSYLDTDSNLLSNDFFNPDLKSRLDSLVRPRVPCYIESLFDEAERRAQELSTVLRERIDLVLHDFDHALADVGVTLPDPAHDHEINLDTFWPLYNGLYQIVCLSLQHMTCLPPEQVNDFDQDRVVITKALILEKCKEYFKLVSVASYLFISCSHECSIVFNHAKVVKFTELLLKPIQDLKFMIESLNSLAKFITEEADAATPEHEQVLFIAATYASLNQDLAELTSFPDFIPIYLNLQIKIDEIRQKEAHQLRALQTVTQHYDTLLQFSPKPTNSAIVHKLPYELPEGLMLDVYQSFLLHPLMQEMLFGNIRDVVRCHEQLLVRLDHCFLQYVGDVPQLISHFCHIISSHYQEYRGVYAALIGEVPYTTELLELLQYRCPEFAYFINHLSKECQTSVLPYNFKYSLPAVYQNVARHIMNYGNFFSVIQDLCSSKPDPVWQHTVDIVHDSIVNIKQSTLHLNDVANSRCLAHAALGAINELPLCVLFTRSQSLKTGPVLIKFGFNAKSKDEAFLYLFSSFIEISVKRKPYTKLLAPREDSKTQVHLVHLHTAEWKKWSIGSESAKTCKIGLNKSAFCPLVVPGPILKALGCNHHVNTNGDKVNTIFLKFESSSAKQAFVSALTS